MTLGDSCDMSTMPQAPTQKFGYLDIKQSSKVRPRTIKSWRRRWAVLTKLTDLSSDEYVAKLDLYDNETKWRSNSFDKMTFVLENVTSVQTIKSRTHQHAFEVVAKQPMLVMSGATELESYSWVITLQQIFTPERIEVTKGHYKVTVFPSEDSSKWYMSGEFTLSVSPNCISLCDSGGVCVISWALSTIMRFNVQKSPVTGQTTMLVIESGPNSPTGQSCFYFQSSEAQDIMCAIKQSICLALSHKQQEASTKPRKLSISDSERSTESQMSSHFGIPSILRQRSDSESSRSTINCGSSSSPVPSLTASNFSTDLRSPSQAEENLQACIVTQDIKDTCACQHINKSEIKGLMHTRSNSHPVKSSKSDYSEIRDVASGEFNVSRRNSFAGEPSGHELERLRSVSAVVSSIQAGKEHNPVRSVSFQDGEDDQDRDSAIPLSAHNDSLPLADMQQCQKCGCTNKCDGDILDRTRSSSTPDLQAFWKNHDVCRFENVYEDLDELRASVQRLNKKQDSDTPPELPARPFAMSFTSTVDHNQKTSMKKKKSIFKRYGKSFSTDSKDKVTSPCICDRVKGRSPRSISGCAHCKGREDSRFIHTRKSPIAKTARKEKLLKGTYLSINNVNDTNILGVQDVNRQISSDSIPSFCFNPSTTDKVIAKTRSLPSYGKDQQVWPTSESCTGKNAWVNKGEENIQEVRAATLTSTPAPVKSIPSNPLINFFLDDVNFESNPMVTGKFSKLPTPMSSSLDLLTMSTSVHQVRSSDSAHELNTESLIDPFFSLSANNFSTFNIWSDHDVKNQHKNFSEEAHTASFFSEPFPFDPFLWSLNRRCYTFPETRYIQNSESNYMAMGMRSESACNQMNISMAEVNNNMAIKSSEMCYLAVSGMKVDDIYIQPQR